MTKKFELKDDTQPVFKKKRTMPFAPLPQINEELDRLKEPESCRRLNTINGLH